VVTALVYEPNGLTTGKGTLSDDVLAHAGLRNIAGSLSSGAYAPVPLERVIATPPRLLVMDESYSASSSRAQALLRHPAFAALKEKTVIYRMKSRLLLCPGPWVADAVVALADRRDALAASLAKP
jgi:iron complex transport system substrate-binding protein